MTRPAPAFDLARSSCLAHGLLGSLMAAALACAAAPAPATAADAPAVAVVFDASGSMWGRLEAERQSKLVLAREALRQSLARLPKEVGVALVTFPGRRRSDCSETETLLKPEPGTPDRVAGALDKLNPKGKGPLVLGLRDAAASLAGQAGPSSLLLLHDDADNCGQDACAAAAELKRAHPRLAVHVIGLGLKQEDIARSSCVASATGGTFANVRDQAGLQRALDEAVKLAGRVAAGRPQTAGRGEAAKPGVPTAAGRARADGPPGLALAARLKAGGPLIDAPITWRVASLAAGAADPIPAAGATPALELRPGTYRVEAEGGLVRRQAQFEVGAKGLAPAEIVLDAGIVDIAVLARRGQPALDDAIVSITAKGAAAETRALLKGSVAGLLVPAGAYDVTVEAGAFRQTQAVTVAAGERVPIEAVLGFGTLQIAIPGADAATPATISVQEDDPDASSGKREIARSAAARAEFRLPAGSYQVVARAGEAEHRERLTVTSGETTVREVPLAPTRLVLGTSARGAPLERSETVAYVIERLDRPGAAPWRTSAVQPSLVLAPGRYRIESRLGDANARATRDVQLAAGRPQSLLIDHDAGRVRLRLAQGAKASDAYWEVRDGASQLVWSGSRAEPLVWLQPGSYKVRVHLRDRRIDQDLTVKAGSDLNFDIKAD